jgi:phage terminase large subunit GpA-like protein
VHAHPERLEQVASYHINMLYQPAGWAYPWSRLAREYIEAYQKMKGGDAGDMKVFTNTKLAKTWKEKLDKVNQASLYQRREIYEAPVPRGVVLLIASVDVQDNRLEAEIVGWGLGEESWGIDYRIFQGSPSLPTVWIEVTDWLQQPRQHACGMELRVEAVGVDTGGHHTKEAYLFIEKYRGIAFALKGSSQDGAPPIPKRKPNRLRNRRLELYLLGTNALKDTLFARMKLTEPGPGYLHFPRRDGYDEEYFRGLASEVKKPKYKPRSAVQIGYYYDKVYTRNEPLDLRVYSLAAMLLLKPNFPALAKRLEDFVPQMELPAEDSVAPQAGAEQTHDAAPEPPEKSLFVTRYNPPRRRGSNFVKGWR